jgi:hypothetical protein
MAGQSERLETVQQKAETARMWEQILELRAPLILTVIHHGQEGGVLLCLHQLEGENDGTDDSKEGARWLRCPSHSRHILAALIAVFCVLTPLSRYLTT